MKIHIMVLSPSCSQGQSVTDVWIDRQNHSSLTISPPHCIRYETHCELSCHKEYTCTMWKPSGSKVMDKENLSRWWDEDRENLRGEPLSLDQALGMSRREVHPEGFPILAYHPDSFFILPKPHFNQMVFFLRSIWPVYSVGKSRLTSLSDVITTCVRTHSRTRNE